MSQVDLYTFYNHNLDVMIKKLLIVSTFIFFSFIGQVSLAAPQDCFDFQEGKCGLSGGCPDGEICTNTGLGNTGYECLSDNACNNECRLTGPGLVCGAATDGCSNSYEACKENSIGARKCVYHPDCDPRVQCDPAKVGQCADDSGCDPQEVCTFKLPFSYVCERNSAICPVCSPVNASSLSCGPASGCAPNEYCTEEPATGDVYCDVDLLGICDDCTGIGTCGPSNGCPSGYECQDAGGTPDCVKNEVKCTTTPGDPASECNTPSCEFINKFNVQISEFMAKIYDALFPIMIFLGVVLTVGAGYIFLFSQGSPEKIKLGSEKLTSAILGVIFIVLSMAIIRVIIKTLIDPSAF